MLAVDLCERCGRFVCPGCLVLRRERALCLACAQRPDGVSTRAKLAFGASLTGLAAGLATCAGVGPVLAPIAWGLPAAIAASVGWVELRAIARGQRSAEGLFFARWAVRLGFAQLLVTVLAIGAALTVMLTRAT